MKIFSGSSNRPLAEKIANNLDVSLGQIKLTTFSSGERYARFEENIRGQDVYLIQSLNSPVNDIIMETLVMIDAAKRASAGRITAVLPYTAYLRQDRKVRSREPISARLLADLISASGVNRVIGMDFHCNQAQGFYSIPVDHLFALPAFISYLREIDENVDIVVSPDIGGVKMASAFASALDSEIGFVDKKRNKEKIESTYLSGDVKGKNVLIPDDLTESGKTLINAAKKCKENGANKVYCSVTHCLLSPAGCSNLESSSFIDEFIFTDSINIDKKSLPDIPFRQISVSSLFSQAILRTHQDRSISELFEIEGF